MDWVANEMTSIDIGDKRLDKRACQLLTALSERMGESIPSACGNWHATKAAYRFFSNDKVTADKLLDPHQLASLERIKSYSRVLFVQDTTEFNYSSQKEKKDVGPGNRQNTKALFLHPILAFTAEQLCLGVMDAHTWSRTLLKRDLCPSKKKRHSQLLHQPICEKESHRWLEGYQTVCHYRQSCPNTQCIVIGDRESDIYDIFHDCAHGNHGLKADWLVRVMINRRLVDEQGKQLPHLLYDELTRAPVLGQHTFKLPKQGQRKARQVTQTIQMVRVRLSPPTGRRGPQRLLPIEATVILAKEINPPKGVEPLHWKLMTNITLSNMEEALEAIKWYLCRWQIEVYFKILKSGCQLENIQLTEASRFKPCIALYLIIAWRILYLTMLARNNPNVSCEQCFIKEEWQLVYLMVKKKPPSDPPITLMEMTRLLGQLGGFTNRRSVPFPGIKCLWRGIKKLYEAFNTQHLLKLMGND